jgi:hypothetical protein
MTLFVLEVRSKVTLGRTKEHDIIRFFEGCRFYKIVKNRTQSHTQSHTQTVTHTQSHTRARHNVILTKFVLTNFFLGRKVGYCSLSVLCH